MTAYKTAVNWHCAYNGRETGRAGETRTVRESLSSLWSLIHATVTRSDAKSQSQHFTGFTHQCWRCVCVWVSDKESVWVFRRHDSRPEGVRQEIQCKKIVSNRKWKSQRALVLDENAQVLLISQQNFICIKHWRKRHEKWDRITQFSLIHRNKAFYMSCRCCFNQKFNPFRRNTKMSAALLDWIRNIRAPL